MNSEKFYDLIGETTEVYRKGDLVEKKEIGNLEVIEYFGYPSIKDSINGNNYEKVDMVFVDVLVDKEKAKERKEELENLLKEYPEPGRLSGGPSYIELAYTLGCEQEAALRFMALGDSLDLWKVMSGKTLGLSENETLNMAGLGFLMISGYNMGEKK